MEKNMSMDIKKWNPWNWFRKEDEQEGGRSLAVRRNGQNGSSLPSFYAGHPLWEMHREMDRLFDSVFQRFNSFVPDVSDSLMLKPNVDIRENKKNYKITVEVPGVDENDVKLEFSDGTLTISGEKKLEKEEGGDDNESNRRKENKRGDFNSRGHRCYAQMPLFPSRSVHKNYSRCYAERPDRVCRSR